MNGTPYWGQETFQDIRDIKKTEYVDLTLNEFSELCKSKGYLVDPSDVYSVFLTLSKLNWLYIFEDEDIFLSWCKDVRFNYRDHFIFIPYYSYSTATVPIRKEIKDNPYIDLVDEKHVNVRYDFTLNSFILDNRKEGFRENILKLYDKDEKVKYTLLLPKLLYWRKPHFSVKDLSERYINSAYIYTDNIVDEGWKDYLKVDNRKKSNKEHQLRKQHGLKLYTKDYKDITYTDVRQYEVDDLFAAANFIDETKPFWLRRYEFEAMLYCIFAQGVEPLEEEYKHPFKQLGKTLRHIKIEGVKPLILKHYYKGESTLRRKSFERYR